MIPAAIAEIGDILNVGIAIVAGFTVFFLLEQLLHWHHCHRAGSACRQSLTYLILIGDALHNVLGGLVAYAVSFQLDVSWLIPIAAGNFLYIGASDLVPEVNKHHDLRANAIHLSAFVLGLALLLFAAAPATT